MTLSALSPARVRRPARLLLALALAFAAFAGDSPAAGGGPRVAIGLRGVAHSQLRICGRPRRVALARPDRASIVVTVSRISTRARVRSAYALRLAVDRCRRGRWIAATRQVRRSRARRWTLSLALAPGDYRLRARIASGATGRAVFLRVPAPSSPGARPGPVPPTPVSPSPAAPDVVDLPVSFTVQNVNRSQLACSSDGAEYRLSGHLVGPAGALVAPVRGRAVTLYLHEFSHAQWFWRFALRDYDYAAAQARAGHVSVVIDRLGYGASPHPPGTQTCLGAQADMAHQIVGQLRAGSYAASGRAGGRGGGAPIQFGRVAIAGHSVGGAVAELETYSFADVDALVLFAWANQGFTAQATQDGVQQGVVCAGGGDPSPGVPSGYAYYNPSDDDFRTLGYSNSEPDVVAAALAQRQRDPCGDVSSLVPAIASSAAHTRDVAVPVLLLYGLGDGVYSQPGAGQQQSQAYTSSPDVTTYFIDGAGHGLTLDRTAPQTRSLVARWLSRHAL
jgi:hypothetical protein